MLLVRMWMVLVTLPKVMFQFQKLTAVVVTGGIVIAVVSMARPIIDV